MLVAMTNRAGAFPTKYWTAGTFDKWQDICADALLERCKVKPRACPKCFLACGNLTEIIDGRQVFTQNWNFCGLAFTKVLPAGPRKAGQKSLSIGRIM